ncbi:MAG TPA: glycosyltransferase family 1 protein [Candidatus Competibacter sp.]|nr:glycosyltransferase family 1 protein [Candidatus Competibacter sp.]
MANCRLNIALPSRYFGWNGGIDFLRHIVNGLQANRENQYQLKVFLLLPIANKIESPTDALRILKRSLEGTIRKKRPWLALPKPDYNSSILDFFNYTYAGEVEIIYHESSNVGMLRCIKRINADIILPINGSLGNDFQIPWVGYIYDFQHRYFPNNFDPIECFNREIGFATILRDSKALIVNSEAVKKDICHFYPWIDPKNIFNLPFAPHPLAEWFEVLEDDLSTKYHLPRKYFLISNQFWIHKDHWTALRALNRIAKIDDIALICTGAMSDYRRPCYLEELKQYIHENGLSEKVRLLGHIPKREQIEIMKSAVAVIQPTLFEGGPGGGSVYDAISLGVPVILSDISVNKEVVAENVHFFSVGNDEELAAQMIAMIEAKITRPSQEKLLRMGQDNLSKLGDRLLEAIEYVRRA